MMIDKIDEWAKDELISHGYVRDCIFISPKDFSELLGKIDIPGIKIVKLHLSGGDVTIHPCIWAKEGIIYPFETPEDIKKIVRNEQFNKTWDDLILSDD